MKRLPFIFFALLSIAFFSASNPLFAGEEPEPSSTEPSSTEPIFGPFKAIKIDSAYIQGVKVDTAGKIWLMLQPDVRKKELILKNSTQEGSGYRNWYNGTQQLVSPANQNKTPNTWTDWVETTAPFIEYWMDGKLILHLKRIK